MAQGHEDLLKALAIVEGPLRFALRSEVALARLQGLGDLALKAASVARGLPLSRPQTDRLERIVGNARSFDEQPVARRRALIDAIQTDLLALTAMPAAAPTPDPSANKRVRPLTAEGALAPADVEGEELARPLSTLKGVGPSIAQHLAGRGLRTMADVLLFFPRRYEDRREMTTLGNARPGQTAVIRGRIVSYNERFARRRVYELLIEDDAGALMARWYGFRPGAYRGFLPGTPVLVSGEVREARRGGLEMVHPDLEMGDQSEDEASFGRIIPIYTEIEGVSARHFRRIALRVVAACGHLIPDFLPEAFRRQHDLVELSTAIAAVHFPDHDSDLEQILRFSAPPQKRLVFDELFFLQLGMALKKRGVQLERGIPLVADEKILRKALERLPFQMTGAQRKALDEIAGDLRRPTPMNRLLQGDVGSGKTAVALASAMIAVENGYQAAIMAPTELLAEQHLRTFQKLLGGDLFEGKKGLPPIRTALLAAGRKPKELERTKNEIASGTVKIAVGTHSLIQEGVDFHRLGVVVIDEQHRFGVLQRARLMEKGIRPHVLVMTATPIPRTLALTLYGDLDVSIIDELPPGRTPVVTKLFSSRTRAKAFDFVRKQVNLGHQAYIVLPLVEESEKIELRAATEEAARLQKEELMGLRVGLVHGRMSSEERAHAMELFRRNEIQVLVATTVIEVGVDVPNASVMLIDHAERFGLSQLHQLRGRVGRGAAKSFCLLVAEEDKTSADARERLQAMVATTDGFRLAEKDLEIRGPGEFLGTRQSGMPDLMVADLVRDQKTLKDAREAAFALIADDPEFRQPEHRTIAVELKRRWAGKMSLARIG
jgi:ATP-dependent DNA helicase RecG